MASIVFSRHASLDEMAREIDRRGEVIERLEPQLAAAIKQLAAMRERAERAEAELARQKGA